MENTIRRGMTTAVVGAVVGAVLLPLWGTAAYAADPAPGSSQGGSPGPSAPGGVKVSTELPKTITVDNADGKVGGLTATVVNDGGAATPDVELKVVGFDALKVTRVEGCSAIPAAELPEGANSGFTCAVGKLEAGGRRTYRVSAAYDLKGKGKICLPVSTAGGSGTLLWQQGPVPFGATKPTPNAPNTPLQLGTENVPLQPASGSPSATPTDQAPSPAPSRPGELPRTGAPGGAATAVLGGVGAALLVAGCAGVWATGRRREGRG
jgi:hypothetical protein